VRETGRLAESGNDLAISPWELWHYSYVPGIGKDVDFRFVDSCRCGEFRIPVDDSDLKKYSPK
jgi:hypothetical protein